MLLSQRLGQAEEVTLTVHVEADDVRADSFNRLRLIVRDTNRNLVKTMISVPSDFSGYF
jgi:hypothetical protein